MTYMSLYLIMALSRTVSIDPSRFFLKSEQGTVIALLEKIMNTRLWIQGDVS